MKKLWLAFGLLVFAGACSDKQEEQNPENLPLEEVLEEGEQVVVRPNLYINLEKKPTLTNSAKARPAVTKAATWSVP